MRLSKIKLAGFKSFVDPTSIDFRSNLTGILGPNGCGKSNTIDAVRWVMGESSAKHLRGQSMEDVIFNGSSSRKPVGQASVELVFDNSDKSLGGEYAKFDELSIKRLVSRDGQSKYFLNGSRCRRRDITDIFLGTGLGPRSYAIIEQGMISRLIEAKPEELRVYLEEAAGISKYKERRREAENRMRHTRESLERLADLREEVGKQLVRLKRQSQAAIKFKEYKAEERKLTAELILLKLQEQQTALQQRHAELDHQATEHQAALTELRGLERQLEEQRQEQEKANDNFNTVQGDYYRIGAEISRLEQKIQHQQELQQRQQAELQQAQQELEEALLHVEEDTEKLHDTIEQLAELEPQLEEQSQELEMANERLFEAEQNRSDWQEQWAELQEKAAEPTQTAQIEKNRMEQLEQNIKHNQQRLERLQSEAGAYQLDSLLAELEEISQQREMLAEEKEELQQQQEDSREALQQTQDEQKHLKNKLDVQRSKIQTIKGRLASLEALQQAGLGKEDKSLAKWLESNQLADAQRLAETIQIESGWEKALETVLAQQLEAICVDDFTAVASQLESLNKGSVQLFSLAATPANEGLDADNSLAQKVKQPAAVKSLLTGIYCAETLAEALAQQPRLQTGESIITRDGIWLGVNWLRLNRSESHHDGVLARQQEIDTLQAELETLAKELDATEQAIDEQQQRISHLEQQTQEYQQAYNQAHQQHSKLEAAYQSQQSRIENAQLRVEQINQEQQELQQRIEQEQNEHEQARQRRNQAVSLMEQFAVEKEKLQASRDGLQEAVSHASEQVQQLRDAVNESRVQIESLRTQKQLSEEQLARLNERLEILQQRQEELLEQMQQQDEPEEDLEEQLQTALANRQVSEDKLTQARDYLQTIDNRIRQLEQQRVSAEHQIETKRTAIENLKLQWQEIKGREEALLEQFAETEYQAEELAKEIPNDASIEQHQQQIDKIQAAIQRLGAINLAAIEEYEEESQRQEYLEQQNADLESALATLETAINKIDRETRSRFKETFEQVSNRVRTMFPKLFGGGEAYLEMTGDDLLSTGVAIMARPPGKKISSIHLMSGGEKALTAVSMVFAIFELNPAPFCMLDEVDAPLDEANVGRFANLVKEMSEHVQFIFITHNKTTMELAENLVGVTMREAGVSRLVSVDLEEAVRIVET